MTNSGGHGHAICMGDVHISFCHGYVIWVIHAVPSSIMVISNDPY